MKTPLVSHLKLWVSFIAHIMEHISQKARKDGNERVTRSYNKHRAMSSDVDKQVMQKTYYGITSKDARSFSDRTTYNNEKERIVQRSCHS